jgi:hypothetical protein
LNFELRQDLIPNFDLVDATLKPVGIVIVVSANRKVSREICRESKTRYGVYELTILENLEGATSVVSQCDMNPGPLRNYRTGYGCKVGVSVVVISKNAQFSNRTVCLNSKIE